MANLVLDQYAELIREVDNMCRQARELSQRLHAELATRASNDQQFLSLGSLSADTRHTIGGLETVEAKTRTSPIAAPLVGSQRRSDARAGQRLRLASRHIVATAYSEKTRIDGRAIIPPSSSIPH